MCKKCFSSQKQKAMYYKIQSEKNNTGKGVDDIETNLKKRLKNFQKVHRFNRWFNLIIGVILIVIAFSYQIWDLANTVIQSIEFTHLVVTVLGISLLSNVIWNWKTTPELDLAENAISEIKK
ncbi:MAG: hypothetical protein ACI88H_001597 [Cocleimonas sp.]|jgi:hypothetical protein